MTNFTDVAILLYFCSAMPDWLRTTLEAIIVFEAEVPGTFKFVAAQLAPFSTLHGVDQLTL